MREIEEIYQELMADFSARAGYRPDDSCDMAVRLYAAAAQIQALSVQTDWVLDQSFPQTAAGEYLDRHASLRGLRRAEATRAVGRLRFSVDNVPVTDLRVPAGTVCLTATNVRFQTEAEAVLAAGSLSVETAAVAVEPGTSGNVAAGTVTLLSAVPGGVLRCINPAGFLGGTDGEDDESLRRRILESYRRLPNGANTAFYEETAMAHEGVAAAVAVGRARGIGTVDVCIATAAGAPSAELLEAVRADLQARREIAVDVEVKAPTMNAVAVTAEVAVTEGFVFADVQAAVDKALREKFTGVMLGKPVRLAELGRIIYAVDGVENYHLTAPAADIPAQATVLPQLGTVTLTELEA